MTDDHVDHRDRYVSDTILLVRVSRAATSEQDGYISHAGPVFEKFQLDGLNGIFFSHTFSTFFEQDDI